MGLVMAIYETSETDASPSPEADLVRLLSTAQAHADRTGAPKHEVEDLRALLTACWRRMPAGSQAEIMRGFAPWLAEWEPTQDGE